MKKKQIDLFLKNLDKELGLMAEVILVGASAGSLMGHIRPSFDIDFEIRLKSARSPAKKVRLDKAIMASAHTVGVAVNYSENISGWSMVSYLDYRKTAKPYQKFGKLNVKLIAPEYWTIGKMARFLELDIQDMFKIIKKKKISASKLINVWSHVVRVSDLSLELGQFTEHVSTFLETYGKRLWGKETNVSNLIRRFKSKARVL